MAVSRVSCMKMRTLLFGVILGLLAVVHSTPVNTVSPMPAKALDDVLREAATDGFLVENLSLPSGAAGLPMNQGTGLPATGSLMNQGTGSLMNQGTGSPMNQGTGSPTTNATVDSKEGVTMEGSGGQPIEVATTSMSPQFGAKTASHAQSAAATPQPSDATSSVSTATQTPLVVLSPVPNEGQTSATTIEGQTSATPNEGQTSATPNEGQTSATPNEGQTSATPNEGQTSATPNEGQTSATPKEGQTSATPNEGQTSATPNHISASQTTDPAVSTVGFFSTPGSFSGSGDGELFDLYSATTTRSSVETSAASLTSMTREKVLVLVPISQGSALGELFEPMPTTTAIRGSQRMINDPNNGKIYEGKQETSKAAGTPGWMIIVGFIVGLAALVMLFVAIATRKKWNGPSRASQLEKRTNSIQHKEIEMEMFLQNDHPMGNGNGSEYTAIPLEELPGKYSSR
ncbi:Coagulation factor V [Liparis tanakae]|uniref:Coagulation factor V n=1 Tax=Liparis tanakae TaxID=230148 RepID=A0A4Z2G326_9TELE|nr:Coagulation factor V [Liparis tanakae]